MTTEQLTEALNQALARIELLESYVEERKVQQIAYPLDQSSKNSLGAPALLGEAAVTLTQNKSVPSTPTTISVPAAYAGSIVLEIEGVQYVIGYLATQ